MPIRFTHGDIKKVLKWMGYQKARKDSFIYFGLDINGKPSTVKFDYHKDKDPIATGTGKVISKSLGFRDTEELKEFIRTKGKRK